MPIVGIGLHVLVALYFAVHALRSGQPMYWLLILFSFPLLGSLAYFFVIYLPDSRLERGARKAVKAAVRSLDPSRELRDARAAFEFTPTAQNQMRLAAALLESGAAQEAATNYEACLRGPFASDLEIQWQAARAFFASEQAARAISHLERIRAADANFRSEQVGLLLARALGACGRNAEARTQFDATLGRFSNFEVRVEYAIWAIATGDTLTARRLQGDIEQTLKHWSRHTREFNQALLRRWNVAKAGLNKMDAT
jgi:hypothetical protein